MRNDNQTIVDTFADAVKEKEYFFITGFTGLNDSEIQDFRIKLDEQEVVHRVIKNTLFKRIASKAGIEDEGLQSMLKGQSAFSIGGADVVAVAKVIKDFSKGCENLEIKGAYLDGKILDEGGVLALADLPSRPQLLAKFVGSIASPLYGLVNVLSGNTRNLVGVLQNIKEKKQAEDSE